MRYLLDTNHAMVLLAQPALPKQKRLDVAFIVATPVLGELWYGVQNSSKRKQNERNLRQFLATVDVVPFDTRFVEEFGRIRKELKVQGRTIPQIDVQLAAIARVFELPVLTADHHFEFVFGIVTENWLA